jgi:hypothetical protein
MLEPASLPQGHRRLARPREVPSRGDLPVIRSALIYGTLSWLLIIAAVLLLIRLIP